ncbi:hypothetical protein K1719_040212 [Acacia pycnantha]|nr:hypothetical protein K1719_042931 [Acacia pycnantha]KAI9077866.1 hypothetical protein K1719_040212 [Acacia pycnantha]
MCCISHNSTLHPPSLPPSIHRHLHYPRESHRHFHRLRSLSSYSQLCRRVNRILGSVSDMVTVLEAHFPYRALIHRENLML